MPSEKRVRRLARWNEALGCFFTFPLALRQVILLFLFLSGVGMLLFGMWMQELESGRPSWDKAMRDRMAVNVESRLRRVEFVAKRACERLGEGAMGEAFKLVAEADAELLANVQGVILVLRGDTVVLWSGSYSRSVEQQLARKEQLVVINGMHYYVRAHEYGALTAYAGVGLRRDYPLVNKYLQSGYVPSLSFLKGHLLDYGAPREGGQGGRERVVLQGNVQILIGFLLILLGIFFTPLLLTYRLNVWVTLASIVSGVGWRYLFLHLGVFDGVLGHFFSPSLFAMSRLIPSLGDLFLHAVVLLAVTLLGARLVRYLALSHKISRTTVLWVCGIGAVVVLLFGDMLLRKIVINSTLVIPPYEVASFTLYTQAAYLSLALWFASGSLLAAMFCVQMLRSSVRRAWALWVLLAVAAVVLSMCFWRLAAVPFGPSLVLCVLVFSSLYIPMLKRREEAPFRGIEFLVGFVVVAYVVTCSGSVSWQRNQMVRAQIAERVGGEPDPLLEMMLPQLTQEVERDQTIRRFVLSEQQPLARLRNYFEGQYQRGYLRGYDVRLTVCQRDGYIQSAAGGDLEDCATYYGRIVATEGVGVPASRFYFRRSGLGRISYLGIFPFGEKYHEYYLYVELDSKQPSAFWGYPELLENEPTSRYRIDPIYSTALYKGGELLMHTGKCVYPRTLAAVGYEAGLHGMFEGGGYTHVAKTLTDDMVALVSQEEVSPFDVMGVDSYLLLLFGVLFSVVFRLSGMLHIKSLIGRGIVGRLQLYMAGIMALTMALALVIALYTMRKTLVDKNKTLMREKSQTVLASLGNINLAQAERGNSFQLNRELFELSNRLYCDINVYDSLGWLLGSSRVEVFMKSLVGERMNANAWSALRYEGALQQFTREQIGALRYESVYLPLRRKGKLLGYVNVPYFAHPDEFKQQFQSFTGLLLDFYAVLSGVILLLSFMLANAVLSPLAQLRKSVETLSITEENTQVFYDTPDQIGALFRAYNAMLNQLSRSVAELAESARQRAWQEMARQIAHDIKNPLTPIRLSLQRVLRLRALGNPQWEDRFVEFSEMLENQIDVLARTANTFSTFAKLAEGRASLVDVRETVHRCVQLNSSDARVELREKISEASLKVWIDENNLHRMVNNVIINAVQASSEVEGGVVEVRCYEHNAEVLIEVQDNGRGIPLELQDDIFEVRFTTKSTGSGLGLTIAHAVAEACGGAVSFVTCPPCGTLFRIMIPQAREMLGEVKE